MSANYGSHERNSQRRLQAGGRFKFLSAKIIKFNEKQKTQVIFPSFIYKNLYGFTESKKINPIV